MKLNEEYSNHPVWQTLDELSETLYRHDKGRGALDRAIKTKTKAAVNYVLSFKSKYLLAPLDWPAKLSTAMVQLQRIQNQYNNWVEGGATSASINEIELAISQCIQIFRDWPVQVSSNSAAKFNEAQLILEEVARFRDEQAENEHFAKIQLQNLQSELRDAITKWNAESDALAQLKGEIKSSSAEIIFQTRKDVSKDAIEVKKEYLGIYDAFVKESSEMKSKIEALVEESVNLASLNAGHILSSGYEKHAQSLDALRKRWQITGFMSAALGVVALLVLLFIGGTLDVGVQYFLKSSVTITFGALAAYSFREAGQSGKAAEIARYRHLDSVALSTYLNGLKSEDTIITIQEELGKRLASERISVNNHDAKSSSKITRQLIKSLEKLVRIASR